MAESTNRGFLGGDQSAAKIRRDYIEKPLAAAKLPIMGTGLELFNFLSVLPDAFIASQQRELERVRASSEKDDARVANLEASIQQATTLRTTIKRGEARANRAMSSYGDRENAFHGFVSNGNFEPIPALTVRLNARETGKRGLTATTDEDGYFRIPLGAKTESGKERREQVGETSFTEKLRMFEERVVARSVTPSSDANAAETRTVAQAEILQGNDVVYEDPNNVPTSDGSVYREYVLTSLKPQSEGYYEAREEVEKEESKPSQVKRAPKKRTKK